jgi:glycosyltransferase involved in cell wall biosynthesis
MKLLLWSQYFWPETFQINQLVVALQKQGVDITVFTGKPNYPEGKIFPNYRFRGVQEEQYFGVKIIRIPLIPRKKNSLLQLTLNYLSFIIFGLIYAPFLLRGKKFNAVFVYGLSPLLQALPAIFVSKIKRIPLVIWVQDIWPEALISTGYIKNKFLLACVKRIVQYIYRHCDTILIQSEAFRKSVQFLVDKPEKIYYYPNSVIEQYSQANNSDLIPESMRQLLEEKFSIVFTGNIGKVQSFQTILDAAERVIQHREIHFFLIGSGSLFKRVQEEIQCRQLINVSLIPQLPVSHMPHIYSRAQVLLITLNDHPDLNKTIPSKLCGYLAAGKPILASLNGEAARIIKDAHAGLTGEAENYVVLAENILSLFLMNETERNQFGVNGKEYFKQNFELTKCSKELIILLQKITMNYSQGVCE